MLITSQGLKRLGATLLLPILAALQSSPDPVAAMCVQILSPIAAALGVTGIVQANKRGTLKVYILGTLGAIIAVIQLIPSLHQYLPLFQGPFIFLAGSALGEKINEDGK